MLGGEVAIEAPRAGYDHGAFRNLKFAARAPADRAPVHNVVNTRRGRQHNTRSENSITAHHPSLINPTAAADEHVVFDDKIGRASCRERVQIASVISAVEE